jgi:hypothetical protein
MLFLLVILVYNLAVLAPSLADCVPAAIGHPYFGSGMDLDRVDICPWLAPLQLPAPRHLVYT